MTPLSVREQDRRMRAEFPSFRLCLDIDWIGIWEGVLCPIAQPYLVRIVYFTRRQFPTWQLANPYVSVTVLDPPVGPDPRGSGEQVPHIYGLGCDPAYPRLCLCHRQWETDPAGNSNLTHRARWFLLDGGADADGGGSDGVGRLEEARFGYS